MITQRLRSGTSHWHELTEKGAFSAEIMNGTLSLEQYKTLLVKNYMIHFFAEDLLHKSDISIQLPGLELEERKRLAFLQSDLEALNVKIPDLTTLENPFEIESKYDALGLMYVLEGSTLGGRVILKALARNPDFADVKAFRFYEGHGEDTGHFWKKYQEILINEANDESAEDRIVNAANKTFEKVADIFCSSLSTN